MTGNHCKPLYNFIFSVHPPVPYFPLPFPETHILPSCFFGFIPFLSATCTSLSSSHPYISAYLHSPHNTAPHSAQLSHPPPSAHPCICAQGSHVFQLLKMPSPLPRVSSIHGPLHNISLYLAPLLPYTCVRRRRGEKKLLLDGSLIGSDSSSPPCFYFSQAFSDEGHKWQGWS